jgi:hypothetical protein
MPQLIYNWKRFWCLRDGGFHIDANGFLVRSEYFKDNTVQFESIAGTPCLVLLGEPGIGKSRALKDAVQFASTTVGDDKCFSLDVRSAVKRDCMTQFSKVRKWKNG